MGWFKREKPVKCGQAQFCITCGLHYKTRPYDEEFPSYCANCRKPHKERADRIRLVKEWAEANFEKLEPKAKRWQEDRKKNCAKFGQGFTALPQYQYDQALRNQFYASSLGNMMGRGYGR